MSQWEGPDRRQAPDPAALQAELRAVRQDVGRLATSVATLGSDERMQQVINSVVEEEKRHRQRLLTKVIVGLVVIGVVVAVGAAWSHDGKDAAHSAAKAAESAAEAASYGKQVATYVDHCLVHPALATPGECGNTAATGAQSSAVLALFCYLQLPQERRTEPAAQDCFTKATAQAKAAAAAATTTTTRRP